MVDTLDKPTVLALALRNRVQRLGNEGIALDEIDKLGQTLLGLPLADGASRSRRNAHLSQLFPFFAPPTRQAILDFWRDQGTKGADQRWLRAFTDDPLFFKVDTVIDYWRRTGDQGAASILANNAPPDVLPALLIELVAKGAPGWVVSKAALRAASILTHHAQSVVLPDSDVVRSSCAPGIGVRFR